MADTTKVTYSLNICFFLITFKANNGDFYLVLDTLFNDIVMYMLGFLHNSTE